MTVFEGVAPAATKRGVFFLFPGTYQKLLPNASLFGGEGLNAQLLGVPR